MVIRILIFFVACQASLTCYAQLSQDELDSLVSRYARNLQKQGVDTLCIYKEYCIGCLFTPVNGTSLCAENFSSLPTYIFWKDKGKTFATRKDICFDYTTQPIANDSFWQYFFANRDKIKKEQLKSPQYIEEVDGKKATRSLDIEQSVYFTITIKTRKEMVTKEINSFYFSRELGAAEELNINYEYNILTALNSLHSMLQRITRNETVKSRFIRTLR